MKTYTTIFLILVSNYLFSQSGLVSSFTFNGNVNDVSGNANNGSIIGSGLSLTSDRFGNVNSAYNFDGNIGQINASLPFSSSLTISFWAYTQTQKAKYPLFFFLSTNGSAAVASDYRVYSQVGNNSVAFRTSTSVKNTSDWYDINGIALDTVKWKLITYTFDRTANKISVYIDGVLKTELGTQGDLVNFNRLHIGGDGVADGAHTFKGKLDDFRVYNRSLSATEITSIFNENKCFEKIMVSDTLKISGAITGLNDLPTNFGTVKIYPNPAHSVLNIAVSNPSNNYSIKITNTTSQEVYSNQLTNTTYQINLSSFGTKGLYYIQILDNTNKILETKKLILE